MSPAGELVPHAGGHLSWHEVDWHGPGELGQQVWFNALTGCYSCAWSYVERVTGVTFVHHGPGRLRATVQIASPEYRDVLGPERRAYLSRATAANAAGLADLSRRIDAFERRVCGIAPPAGDA